MLRSKLMLPASILPLKPPSVAGRHFVVAKFPAYDVRCSAQNQLAWFDPLRRRDYTPLESWACHLQLLEVARKGLRQKIWKVLTSVTGNVRKIPVNLKAQGR
jgi:hypothetical protein